MTNDPHTTALPPNAYLAFDGTDIRERIIQRLNQTGVYQDQNFVGSNLAVLNDAIALVFSQLLFYLSRTSSEALYSETLLYENMNRIVKELGYNPLGPQTSIAPVVITPNSGVADGTYYIPRFSYINAGRTRYTLMQDVELTIENDQLITSVNPLLHQGTVMEFPLQQAEGIPNEIYLLASPINELVDNFTITVFVKKDDQWREWKKVQNLYSANSQDEVFESRYNENRQYEIKFGNNINGKQLSPGSEIAIYYLISNAESGQIGTNSLFGRFFEYQTTQWNMIKESMNYIGSNIIDFDNIVVQNTSPSSQFADAESVEDIRNNAPSIFRSQYRLVSKTDYEVFIKSNYSNLVADVVCMNNADFMDSYLKYYYDLGITNVQDVPRVLVNQIEFSTSNLTHNVYAFILPKYTTNPIYLNMAFKSLVSRDIEKTKTMGNHVVIMDPVYIYIQIGVSEQNKNPAMENRETSYLEIVKARNSQRSDESIQNDVYRVLEKYFTSIKYSMGVRISPLEIQAEIMQINGVQDVFTCNGENRLQGIHFLLWDDQFTQTINKINGTLNLELFQAPVFVYPARTSIKIHK
jgi:hypothetical protein